MAILYIGPTGKSVQVHSYSSGALFDDCAKRYYLQKIAGWRRKGNKASLQFGRCVEDAIQYFHASNMASGSGLDEFKRLWLKHKEDITLEFTAKEGSWSELYRMGAAMLRLYELRLPTLPIVLPAFQLNYKREPFPNTEYAGIEHTAFIDMVSKAPWTHPLLPKVDKPAGSAYRPLLVDIKTASTALGAAEEMLSLDPQLREYAWTTGIADIAFLWLVKAGHGSWCRGDSVSVLDDCGVFKASDQAVVIFVQKPDKFAPEETTLLDAFAKPKRKSTQPPKEPITEELIGCVPPALIYDFEKGAADLKGKALEEFKIAFVEAWGAKVPPDSVTKVKLQFAATRISAEDMAEAGQNVGRQIVSIVEANRLGQFPKKPSIRFPNTKCTMCEMKGHCLGKTELVERLLVQIKPTDKDPVMIEKDWIDDFLAEE